MLLALAFMFSICTTQYQQSLATRPSELTLVAHDDDAAAISPAMVAFFGGNKAPEATNSSTVPKWRLPAPELQQEGNGKRRTIILVAGVVCGVVGAGLLVAAVVAFAANNKSQPEVQLAAV